MNLPSYAVECDECRYERGMFGMMMGAVAIESQGTNWVNVEYLCPMCGQNDYSLFPVSLSDLCDMV